MNAPLPPSSRAPRTAVLLLLALFATLASATWWHHSDFGDAQLYRVVVRHMVQDDSWLQLRYLPGVYPRFYEHLPFGLWPFAAAARLWGEWALQPVALLFWLGTLLLVARTARRLAGPWAAAASLFTLALCDNVYLRAGQPFLDGPLVLLTTASAMPLLLRPPRAGDWALCGALAMLAVAVKGPFGLVPFAAVVLARAVMERSARTLVLGAAVGLLAALPTLLFVLGNADWREHYGRAQLLASASGARTDGRGGVLLPLRTVVSRFWPGAPLLLAAAALALGRPRTLAQHLRGTQGERAQRNVRLLALAVLFALAALCVPHRKLWFHALPVFPLLALLAGAAVGPWLERALALPARARRLQAALLALLVAAAAAAALGLPRVFISSPCPVSRELAPWLAREAAGTPVLVVSAAHRWDMLSALAAERRLLGWPVRTLHEPLPAGAPAFQLALVYQDASAEAPGWQQVGEGRGWRVLRRAPAP